MTTILENAHLRIEVADLGAELRSLQAGGAEWLWHGDPAWWTGRSPLLFPVVGQSPEGRVTIEGESHPMAPHGFARISRFRRLDLTDTSVTFGLEADAATRASYPFEFLFRMTYRLDGPHLRCEASVINRDSREMPFQFGFHPAFVLPLPQSGGQAHRVRLANGAAPDMRRPVEGGLLGEATLPSPFVAGMLEPVPALFDDGAMIFPTGAGERFVYESDGARVEMEVTNLPNFALWQKPGAPYLCLEPWHGMAPTAGQGPDLRMRGDCLVLPPGQEATFAMTLRVAAVK